MAVLQSFILSTVSPGYMSWVDLVLGIMATMYLVGITEDARVEKIVTTTVHAMECHNIISGNIEN